MIPWCQLVIPLLGLTASPSVAALATNNQTPRAHIGPSHESARANAHHIFNAIHSAARQWGSSLNHNGFGFFPATVARGTVLYHGNRYAHPPTWPEWLAFEVEHAEAFAQSFAHRFPPPSGNRSAASPAEDAQIPLGNHHEPRDQDEEPDKDPAIHRSRGYFHTYRATRDLNLLYIDGMSAGKSDMGMMDSQDLILLENKYIDGIMDDWNRAGRLCELLPQWGYDGIMRMEIGFEVIFCDFSSGLQLMSVERTYYPNDTLDAHYTDLQMYQWARAVGERYDGLGSRVRLDFSSMVSGFFFPINISSTDANRTDLIRLAAAGADDLKGIKNHLHQVSNATRRFTVDWQTVIDMVVSRFAERLAHMGWGDLSPPSFISELQRATLTYVNAPPQPDDDGINANKKNETAEAIDRCTKSYLLPALLVQADWSVEDSLIHTALDTVLGNICSTLFLVRSLLLEASPDVSSHGYRIKVGDHNPALNDAVEVGRGLIHDLLEQLAWTEWEKPRRCPLGEIAYIAMWPFGDSDDHWHPGCRTLEQMKHPGWGYWLPR